MIKYANRVFPINTVHIVFSLLPSPPHCLLYYLYTSADFCFAYILYVASYE